MMCTTPIRPKMECFTFAYCQRKGDSRGACGFFFAVICYYNEICYDVIVPLLFTIPILPQILIKLSLIWQRTRNFLVLAISVFGFRMMWHIQFRFGFCLIYNKKSTVWEVRPLSDDARWIKNNWFFYWFILETWKSAHNC